MARRARNKSVQEQEEVDPAVAFMDELFEEVNGSDPGTLVYMEGSSSRWPDNKIIRSGSLGIDMRIGIGGYPRGRIIEVFGAESSGKTTTMLHAVREAQKVGVPVIYIDAENALVPNYCKKIGVDLEKMAICQPSSMENAIDLMAQVMTNAHSKGISVLIVVDSVPMLAPQAILDSNAGDSQRRAGRAALWSDQLPRLVPLASQSDSTIFLINQTRDSMDMYKPESTPGGRAIKFNASVRIRLTGMPDNKKLEEGSPGQTVLFNIIKNKVGSPFKKGEFHLPAGEPIYWARDVLFQACYHVDVVAEGWKCEGGVAELFQKKDWFTYLLREGDYELMEQDNAKAEENGEEPEPLPEEPYVSVFRFGNFVSKMSHWPTLISKIENLTLDQLNLGDENEEESVADSESYEDGTGQKIAEQRRSSENEEYSEDSGQEVEDSSEKANEMEHA